MSAVKRCQLSKDVSRCSYKADEFVLPSDWISGEGTKIMGSVSTGRGVAISQSDEEVVGKG